MGPVDDTAGPTPDQRSGLRIDPYLGTAVHIVGSRQERPITSQTVTSGASSDMSGACPFCPGGREAPETYRTRWFVNRWPALPDDRCEVLLYSPDHQASLATMGTAGARAVVDLWIERTETLGSRSDVAYVLIFENRGADVGATIAHPHGQIYAYDHVPPRPAAMFTNRWRPTATPDLVVAQHDGWLVAVPKAPAYPAALSVAPVTRVGALPDLDDHQRTALAVTLVDVARRLDALHDRALPYMMWINQRPTDGTHPDAWLNIEIVSPWRSAGVLRYIAAAEIGGGEFFNPVVPEDLATTLRRL